MARRRTAPGVSPKAWQTSPTVKYGRAGIPRVVTAWASHSVYAAMLAPVATP